MEDDQNEEPKLEWQEIARIAFVAIACAAVWFRIWEPYSRVSVVGLIAALVGVSPYPERSI